MSYSDQIFSMAFFMVLLYAIRYFDLANPEYIVFIRILYFISQLAQLSLSLLVLNIISKKNETATKIVVTEPQKPFSDEPPTSTEMTLQKYDRMKTLDLIKQNLFNCSFVLFLHLKFGYIQPLIPQSILTLKTFFTTPIIKIHLLRFAPIGELSRPFKPPASPFAALFQNDNDDSSPKEEQKTLFTENIANASDITESLIPTVPTEELKIRKKPIKVK